MAVERGRRIAHSAAAAGQAVEPVTRGEVSEVPPTVSHPGVNLGS